MSVYCARGSANKADWFPSGRVSRAEAGSACKGTGLQHYRFVEFVRIARGHFPLALLHGSPRVTNEGWVSLPVQLTPDFECACGRGSAVGAGVRLFRRAPYPFIEICAARQNLARSAGDACLR